MKKAKYLFFALAIALAGVFQLGGEANALSTYKNIRQLKTGDIIYFNNSGTNWNEVRVYLFSKSGGSERFNWDSRPTMTQIGETGVYKYEITNDLNIENYKDDHIIFSDNARHQTVNLGFIETGYAYLVDSEEGGKAKGYWYVYDKSELVDLIRSAKEYEAYSDYLSSASYDELATQIRNAEGVVNSEIRVETDYDGRGFYSNFDIALEDLQKSIDDLEIDTGKLKEKLDEEISNIDRDKYTDDSLNDLDDAISAAEDVLNNPDSTVEDIKNAADNVLEAIENLEEKAPVEPEQPDTGKLKEILDEEISNIDRDKYTDDSLNDLDDAIRAAEDVLNNPDSTVEDIKNAADNVLEAIENLKEKAPVEPEKPDTDGENPEDSIPANPSTLDDVEAAAAGISISSVVGYVLYIVAKQRR